MTTRLNRYYNNPNIGAAASNLASLFAPPSPQDMLAYSTVQQQQAEEKRIADFLGMGAGADPLQLDIHGAAAGLYSPNQGFHAVNLGDATDRRGQDLSYSATTRGQDVNRATALDTNRLDNQTRLVGDMFGPLNQGQVRPAVPENVMGIFDMPGLDAELGLDKPMSVDETVAANMDPETARILGLSDIPIETILDENGGAPAIVPRGMAWGQEPYIAQGSPPALQFKTYVDTVTGQQGIAVLDPTSGVAKDQASGAPLGPGAVIGDIVDTTEGLTTGTTSRAQRNVMDIDLALDTTRRLAELVASAPASGGAVGNIRGWIQDMAATGNEIGALARSLDETTSDALQSGVFDPGALAIVQSAYDPNIPARQALTIMAATQIAKAQSPDRVSNELMQRILAGLGEGSLLANQNRTEASLTAIINDLESRRVIASQFAGPGVPPMATQPGVPGAAMPQTPLGGAPAAPPAAPQQRPRAVNPQTNQVIEWDGQAWVPTQ